MVDLVQVSGLRELEVQLRALGEEYGPKAASSPIRYALGKAGKVIQASAKARVHVKTGTLRENIIVTTYKRPPEGQIGVEVTVRSKAKLYQATHRNVVRVIKGEIGLEYRNYGPLFYGKFLEFGTSHQPAYPFMRPAFEENKGSLPDLIKNELAKAIDRSVQRLGGKA